MKTSITITELEQWVQSGRCFFLIDVRGKDEYLHQHIPFAGNLPIGVIEEGHFIPEPNKTIITVCGKGGGRSERAAHYLREHFPNPVFFLDGGTTAWYLSKNETI